MIRKAKIQDVKEIHNLLLCYSKQGILLGRSLSDLYDQIRDFFVSVDPVDNSITGVCGLHISWEDLAEVRSLAVREDMKSAGTGRLLVQACIDEACDFGVRRLFVLTYVPDFFRKMGFNSVDKSVLPHKVWSDCVTCIHFPDCDEDALIRHL
ncbi:MAG: N-acetyltransferase [Deltaproteobacteria bacterium]|nr:N-acetyltransferase [Deltaproteobacteria bacterium]